MGNCDAERAGNRCHASGFVQAANPASSALTLIDGYQYAASQLQEKTKVPLRLPAWVPYDNDQSNPLFARVQTVSADKYQVEIGWDPECHGATACHLGYINGSAALLPENKGPKVPVTLNGGVKSYFIDAGCAASCGDSAIYWTQGNYHYSITMKAETKETLTKVANSAMGAEN
jgi:hypothetical protein